MRLTKYEKETIINFNELEPMAYIFTYSKTWQKHLEGKLGLKPTMDNGYGGKEYQIPKERIRPPRAPNRLSEGRRKKLADNLRQKRNLRVENTKILMETGDANGN